MVTYASIYNCSKSILADILYRLYVNDIESFMNVVNFQLNSWDRRNVVLLFVHNKPITRDNIYDALMS